MALVVLGLLLAVGVWAYDDAQKDQIAPGVTIGGVDVGGRDADSARKIIKRAGGRAAASSRSSSATRARTTRSVAEAAPEHADVDGMVQEAIDRSRQGNILDRVSRYASGGDVNADLAPRVSLRQGGGQGLRQPARRQRSTRTRPTPRSCRAADEAAEEGGPSGSRRRAGRRLTERDQRRRPVAGPRPDGRRGRQARPSRRSPRRTSPHVPALHRHRPRRASRCASRNLKLAKTLHGRGRPAGPRDPGRPLPHPGQAGRPLLARARLGLGREPRRPGDPAGPGRPAQGALDGDLRRRRHPRHRRDLARSARAASHGCVRMAIPDVIDLYDRVEVGDPDLHRLTHGAGSRRARAAKSCTCARRLGETLL